MLRANELGLFGQFFPPAVSSRLPLGHVAWPVPQQCHSLLFSLAQKYTFPQYEPKKPAFFARHSPRLKDATSRNRRSLTYGSAQTGKKAALSKKASNEEKKCKIRCFFAVFSENVVFLQCQK